MKTGEFNQWVRSLALETINHRFSKNADLITQLCVLEGKILGFKDGAKLSPNQAQYVEGMLSALETIKVIEVAQLQSVIN